jgi:hypothetical protein
MVIHQKPPMTTHQKQKTGPVASTPTTTKSSNQPRKEPGPSVYRCHQCSETFENREEHYVHRMRTHYQIGGGGLQARPWGDNSPPWEMEDGTVNQPLWDNYEANTPYILEQHRPGPVQSFYNFPIENDVTVDQLMRFSEEIYRRQQHAFRINLTFGVILRNRETGEYRYFIPLTNKTAMENPVYISKSTDLRRLRLRLSRLDLTTELLRNRPDTKWIPVLITNVLFFVYSTHYPVGTGVVLPDYLLRKDSLYPLVKNRNTGKAYKDDLCTFRCLALHRGYDIKSIDGAARAYYQQWVEFKRLEKEEEDEEEVHVVSLEEFPEFEAQFLVNLEVYSLEEDGGARSIYKSRGRYDTSLYVNLYENHLSYIRDFVVYAKKFQCKTCDRHFKRSNGLHRHQQVCTNQTKLVYPGGFYKPFESIFEQLDAFGIHVPEDQRTFPWFACFDFEALLKPVNESTTGNLTWVQQHVPISVSICSNVEGFTEPLCIVEPDQDKLVEAMVASLLEIGAKSNELAEEKWGWVLEEIESKLQSGDIGLEAVLNTLTKADDAEEEDEEEAEEEDECKPLRKLYGQFQGYMTQLPVLGFNSAKYDLNLIKQRLAKHLNLHDSTGTFVVKKNNSYTCISTPELKFLDISQFLAAGSSYAAFLKAYNVEQHKGFFAYDYFDDISKLEETALPPHEAFYNTLKEKNISEEEYLYCQQVWKENHMTTFRDFLVWYNNLDVQPFVSAVERLQQFYFEKGIDVFKTAISVPGIARQLLFQSARQLNASFALCDRSNADLYETIKQNIVGGPSIIFTRHHCAGRTRIRGDKPCAAILGFDANGLYLHCLGLPLPISSFVRRKAETGFRPENRDKFAMAYYWMDWLRHSKGYPILHRMNHGSEVRIGKYPVDGFRPASEGEDQPTCYQFQGCYWHGHECDVTRNVKNPQWWKTREAKFKRTKETTEYLKKRGCHVVEMWECQFKKYCKLNPRIYAFIDSQRPSYFQKHKGQITKDAILKGVAQAGLFGMVEVDIEVPDRWPEYFSHPVMTPHEYFREMSPLFCTTDVPFDVIGEHMQDHVRKHELSAAPRRLLVGGMKARQMLIATPLLKWYLEHGMVVTKIYQVVEYQQQRCFQDFVKEVSDARRRGDVDKNTTILADTMKVIGNSAYGSLIMDKTKHRVMSYVQGENQTCLKVNDPRFRKLDCLDAEEEYYEIEMGKRKIKLDLPTQLGYFVLQYAKLQMLQFYFDFMDVYVDRSDFEYCEMDTDSAYMAISGSTLDDVIKPEMREKYERGLKGFCTDEDIEADGNFHWFPRTCCGKHTKYDMRTPGLFKLEYRGDEMIGLCSKTYIVRKTKTIRPTSTRVTAHRLLCRSKRRKSKRLRIKTHHTNEYKFSSKGITKRNVRAPMTIFRSVLRTGTPKSGINRGFRVRHNAIFTYTQERRGFSYFYCKRRVLDDGIHTEPLDLTLCPIHPKVVEDEEQEEEEEEEEEVEVNDQKLIYMLATMTDRL